MENQQQNEFNLGETLRRQRQQLGLSIEDVAAKTHLKIAMITHIENNELVQASCPPTFMKGYVRNYANFLKIPENIWNHPSILYGDSIRNDLQKNMRNNHKVNHYSSYSSWVGRFTWLIALIMLSMTAYWWWQNYQQSQQERSNLVENFLSSNQNEEPSVSTGILTQLESPVISSIEPKQELNSLPASVQNTMEDHSAIESGSIEKINSSDAVTKNQQQTSGQVLSNVMEQLDGEASGNLAVNENSQDAVNQTNKVINHGLTIEITGSSCWLSVRDVQHKILAQKEYKQGEVLHFADGEPYSLVIGAPQNVKITFKGQEVPLTIDGRVARIKLPK